MANKTEMDKAIERLRQMLEKKKGDLFVKAADGFGKGITMQPVNNDEVEDEEINGLLIKTGTVIDDMIGGGIGVGKSAMVYGAPASGKSQTAFTVLALCENYVVWIDMEDTFSFKRLKEICEARNINYEEKKKKLILYKCNNWFEQMIAVRSIPSPEEIKTMYGENAKIDLIIADSLTDQFRGVEFTGRETLPLKTGMLREFLGALKDNAVVHKAGILYTNQISAKPVATPYASACDTQSPVGGYSVEHKPSFSLHFRKGSGNIRVVRIMDSSFNKLGERAFVINEKGIDNLPKQAEKAQLYEKNSEKFNSTQSQEEKIKEEKRKKKLVYKPEELTEEEVLEEINAVEESLPIEG